MLLYKWYSSEIEKGLQNYILSWGKEANYLKRTVIPLSLVTSSGYELKSSSFCNITYGIKWRTSLGNSDLLQLWSTSSHLKHLYQFITTYFILVHLGTVYLVFCWKILVESVLKVYLYFEKVRKKKVELISSSQINILWSKQNP